MNDSPCWTPALAAGMDSHTATKACGGINKAREQARTGIVVFAGSQRCFVIYLLTNPKLLSPRVCEHI